MIIHCAASVDFDQRLDKALEINVFGAFRVLELAKECRNLQIHIHVSTAYVNSDKTGLINEKLYPMAEAPEAVIDKIKRIPGDKIEAETPGFLKTYPNTYTFTKFIGEHMIVRHREHVPVCFVRPTMIGASWRDPFPGWSDSTAAQAAFFLGTGLGIVQMGIGDFHKIGDQIPVDFVANNIIVAGAKQAMS
jgi:nucleoside-diphosphate-sugar epimerase